MKSENTGKSEDAERGTPNRVESASGFKEPGKMSEKAVKTPSGKQKLAVIRVRGVTGVKSEIKDTMSMLCLHRKNFCVVLEPKPSVMGMVKKAKDFITWGEISDATIMALEKKKTSAKYYRLNPPRKGFGRKGIKVPFVSGGALGYRGDRINDLIIRML